MHRGQGRVFDRPRGSKKNWSIAYYWRNHEQREAVARALGKQPEKVTREDAERLLKARLRQLAEGRSAGANGERVTVNEVLDAYLQHLRVKKAKSYPQLASHLRRVRRGFGHERAAALTRTRIEAWVEQQRTAGFADGTIKVWVALLRAALRLAEEELPRLPKFPAIRVDNARRDFYERDEVERLLPLLPTPIDDLVRLAYLSGWRKEELQSLTWSQVDRRRRTITLTGSKNDEGRVLPLVGERWELIERRWAARIVGDRLVEWVFHRRGRPVRDFTHVWARARRTAGLLNRTLHGFRRTAARDLVEGGMDYKSAMEVTGHKTMSVFQRYQIVDVRRTRVALETLDAHRAAQATASAK